MFWTFVEPSEVASGSVTIDGPGGHHLARVLRVRPGERGVVVASGREYEAEVIEAGRSRVVARIGDSRPVAGEPSIAITLWQAVLPNPDFDAVIENATAVGVYRFTAIQASRSVARPVAQRLTRWQAIARSAAEQSHRGEVPAVTGPIALAEALEHFLDRSRLLILDPRSSTPLARGTDGSRAYRLAIGPEGGWTEEEISMMTAKGGIPVSLGPRILRARLAPVIATAILVQQR